MSNIVLITGRKAGKVVLFINEKRKLIVNTLSLILEASRNYVISQTLVSKFSGRFLQEWYKFRNNATIREQNVFDTKIAVLELSSVRRMITGLVITLAP